jgi:DnaD/phage-associated family protein
MVQTKILFDEQPLVIAPSLAELVGLNESIILQQLHYWLNKNPKEIDGRKWIYNTYDDWKKQFPFWSISTIRRIITTLENLGIILTGNYNQRKFDKTKWYSLDYEKLEELEKNRGVNSASVQNEQTSCSEWTEELSNLNTPIPETTTETTTDITTTGSVIASEQRADTRPIENLSPMKINPANEDEGIAEIMTLYQNNIHPICGSIEADNLADLVSTYSVSWVKAAIQESVLNGVRKLSYITAILQRWHVSGIDEPWLKKKNGKSNSVTSEPSYPSAQSAWEEVYSKLILNKQKGVQWSSEFIAQAVKQVGYMNLMNHGASCMANFIAQYNEVIRNAKSRK